MEEGTGASAPEVSGVPDPKALARAVRVHRGSMTQAELARRVGISQAVLSHWENGDRGLSYDKVFRIEEALGLAHGTVGRTAGYVEDPEPDEASPVKVLVFTSRDGALRAAEAAAILGFGVILDNRTEVLDPDGCEIVEEWVLALRAEPPVASIWPLLA